MKWTRIYRAPRLAVIAGAITFAGIGCAHQSAEKGPSLEERNAVLSQRIEESERINSRLSVRIEELEDAVFLLQDRVEANRITLQRKGYMRSIAQSAQAPGPVPESYYPGSQGYYPDDQRQGSQQPSRREVTRIPIGGEEDIYGNQNNYYQQRQRPQQQERQPRQRQEQVPTQTVRTQQGEDEVVITDKEFREFAGIPSESEGSSRSSSSSSSSTARRAQPNVTSEKLATSEENESSQSESGQASESTAPAAPATAETERKLVPKSAKAKLELYKEALAAYRAGSYSQALSGFEAFLASGPRADYVDNALYWIGECHFGLGDFDSSVSYFQRVISEQPDGNKVPDAMLKMSLAYDRTGRGSDATRLLNQLIDNYPATNAGQLGAKRLQERAE